MTQSSAVKAKKAIYFTPKQNKGLFEAQVNFLSQIPEAKETIEFFLDSKENILAIAGNYVDANTLPFLLVPFLEYSKVKPFLESDFIDCLQKNNIAVESRKTLVKPANKSCVFFGIRSVACDGSALVPANIRTLNKVFLNLYETVLLCRFSGSHLTQVCVAAASLIKSSAQYYVPTVCNLNNKGLIGMNPLDRPLKNARLLLAADRIEF